MASTKKKKKKKKKKKQRKENAEKTVERDLQGRPTSSLTLCDPSYSHLCASLYTCLAIVSVGLPLFPPTNLNGKGELDLHALNCNGYSSVVSMGQYPTDPWGTFSGIV
jgi:hypothetical protein